MRHTLSWWVSQLLVRQQKNVETQESRVLFQLWRGVCSSVLPTLLPQACTLLHQSSTVSPIQHAPQFLLPPQPLFDHSLLLLPPLACPFSPLLLISLHLSQTASSFSSMLSEHQQKEHCEHRIDSQPTLSAGAQSHNAPNS